MKILVLTGSPHKNGTTALLADQFIQGAEEAGHTIWRLDAAFADIHPCLGCDKCRSGQHECVWQDDMRALYPKLLEADMLVFVTPVYYHGASAQIKAAIDRFHGIDDLLRQRPKKAILLAVAADTKDHVLRGVTATYEETLLYLHWQDCGRILALGCYSREDIEKTDYPAQAYALGRGV